jgi:hypothetical protein
VPTRAAAKPSLLPFPYTGPTIANIPMSGRSVAHPGPNADVVTHPISYEGTLLPHGPHVNRPQVSAEMSLLVICLLIS